MKRDRVEIACESHAVRHGVFFKRWQFVFEKKILEKLLTKLLCKRQFCDGFVSLVTKNIRNTLKKTGMESSVP